MRTPIFAILIGAVAVAGCDGGPELAGPSSQTAQPQFHEVTEGTPDGDYSLYFLGLESIGDLAVWAKQSWAVDPDPWATECPNNTGSHADGDPDFPGDANMSPADGKGYFRVLSPGGWRSGILIVQRACWFDEWNLGLGAPESAWVAGIALVGRRSVSFRVKLSSTGFPDESHLLQLDRAELYLAGSLVGVFKGELHHEDGLTP